MAEFKTSRRDFVKLGAGALSASMLPFLKMLPAEAATRDVLVAVTGQTINSLDLHRTGTNRASYQVAVNAYDRLVSFGTKEAPGGGLSYDYSVLEPELAESWTVSDDGLTVTFKLKPNAVFWDGRMVLAGRRGASGRVIRLGTRNTHGRVTAELGTAVSR